MSSKEDKPQSPSVEPANPPERQAILAAKQRNMKQKKSSSHARRAAPHHAKDYVVIWYL
jgi:hypothetical protein